MEISAFTGFPEIMDGRVKTLHPKVHGGLLYLRDNPEPREAGARERHRAHRPRGGESLPLRADRRQAGRDPGGSHREHRYRRPFHAAQRGEELPLRHGRGRSRGLRGRAGKHPRERRRHHPEAPRAARHQGLRHHRRATTPPSPISSTRSRRPPAPFRSRCPSPRACATAKIPHQQAALYGDFDEHFQKLHGKELSYNNILDISAASELIEEFPEPTVAILKHTNPCGVGSDPDLKAAWDKAFATDKQAPFGGIIICNRPLTEPLARAISEIFSEVIIAPDFEPDARALLQKKKNLRLMRKLVAGRAPRKTRLDIRSVLGGCSCRTAIRRRARNSRAWRGKS